MNRSLWCGLIFLSLLGLSYQGGADIDDQEEHFREEQGAQQDQEAARRERERARQAEQEALRQQEAARQRVVEQNLFVTLLALLTLLALILALRKPRQAIVWAAGHAIEPLSRRFKPAGRLPAPGAARAGTANVVLTGFDSRGKPVNIPLPEEELDRKRGGFTLGRHHLLVDTALDDDRISKRHARFTRNGHGYFIEDLNSRNGTVINGEQPCAPFKPMRIRPGDTVRLGGMELLVSA